MPENDQANHPSNRAPIILGALVTLIVILVSAAIAMMLNDPRTHTVQIPYPASDPEDSDVVTPPEEYSGYYDPTRCYKPEPPPMPDGAFPDPYGYYSAKAVPPTTIPPPAMTTPKGDMPGTTVWHEGGNLPSTYQTTTMPTQPWCG